MAKIAKVKTTPKSERKSIFLQTIIKKICRKKTTKKPPKCTPRVFASRTHIIILQMNRYTSIFCYNFATQLLHYLGNFLNGDNTIYTYFHR